MISLGDKLNINFVAPNLSQFGVSGTQNFILLISHTAYFPNIKPSPIHIHPLCRLLL